MSEIFVAGISQARMASSSKKEFEKTSSNTTAITKDFLFRFGFFENSEKSNSTVIQSSGSRRKSSILEMIKNTLISIAYAAYIIFYNAHRQGRNIHQV